MTQDAPAVRIAQTTTLPSDAVVFVSGLGGAEKLDIGHFAALLCWEMNLRAADRTATFSVTPTSVDTDAVHRIERLDATGRKSIVDVYGYNPKASLDGQETKAGSFGRVMTLGLSVLAGILVLAGTSIGRSKPKSLPQVIQLIFCLFVLLVLGAYFLMAVYALAQAVYLALPGGGAGRPWVSWPQWIVLTTAVVGALLPNLRERLNHSADLYLRMMRYVWTSGMRNQLTGEVEHLIDRINERPEVNNVHVVGFSFGSLIALDTLYPGGSRHAAQAQQVRTLTTVGCPFDLIRMLRPPYASGRTRATQDTPRWINIYEPLDVLASNFGPGDQVREDAAVGISLTDDGVVKPDVNAAWNEQSRLDLASFLMLRSLSIHSEYWDRDRTSRNALGILVHHVYGGTPVLA